MIRERDFIPDPIRNTREWLQSTLTSAVSGRHKNDCGQTKPHLSNCPVVGRRRLCQQNWGGLHESMGKRKQRFKEAGEHSRQFLASKPPDIS